jgi:hypothetical protein
MLRGSYSDTDLFNLLVSLQGGGKLCSGWITEGPVLKYTRRSITNTVIAQVQLSTLRGDRWNYSAPTVAFGWSDSFIDAKQSVDDALLEAGYILTEGVP